MVLKNNLMLIRSEEGKTYWCLWKRLARPSWQFRTAEQNWWWLQYKVLWDMLVTVAFICTVSNQIPKVVNEDSHFSLCTKGHQCLTFCKVGLAAGLLPPVLLPWSAYHCAILNFKIFPHFGGLPGPYDLPLLLLIKRDLYTTCNTFICFNVEQAVQVNILQETERLC